MNNDINYKGYSPKKDFRKALNKMLSSYDSLESENIPFDQYPHSEFVFFFTQKIKQLNANNKLTPFSIAYIPFELAKDNEVREPKRMKNREYIDALISLYKENTCDSIYQHLKQLSSGNGSKIYDFDDIKNYPKWEGWIPSNWTNKKELDEVGKEFEFAYSVARFYQLCIVQGKSDPSKVLSFKIFFNLISVKDEDTAQTTDDSLSKLKTFLSQKFTEDTPLEYIQDRIKYFSPYYLTKDELNTFFEWAICLCATDKEKPNLPFLKEIWSLGKLYQIHCYPIDFLDDSSSKINLKLLVKIRALKQQLLNNSIIFPTQEKIKSIEEDWEKKIVFLVKSPYKKVFASFCNIFQYDTDFGKATANSDKNIIEQNKATIEKEKTIHPILDWITLPLNSPKDKRHQIFATVIKILCQFTSNPQLYSKGIKNNLFPILTQITDNKITLSKDNTPNTLPEPFNFNQCDDTLAPYFFIIIGLIERVLYPINLPLKMSESFLQQISSFRNYMLSKEAISTTIFRFNAILGQILKHSKITYFTTIYDFHKVFSCAEELTNLFNELTPSINTATQKQDEESPKVLNEINQNALNKEQLNEYKEIQESLKLHKLAITLQENRNSPFCMPEK